ARLVVTDPQARWGGRVGKSPPSRGGKVRAFPLTLDPHSAGRFCGTVGAMSAPTTADHDQATVADLLRYASDGDQQAWAELIARYTGIVTGVVAGFRLQESDAA